MARYIILNNILSPYRTSFFNALYASGLDCEVYYMRETEADRRWKIDKRAIKHPFYIDRGFYRMIGRYHLHINPRLLLKMLKAKDAEFIIAGGWNDVDVLLLALFKRLGLLKNRFHFWSEANYLTYGSSRDNFLKRIIRKFVFYSANDAMIIPGRMSELTFAKWGITGKRYIGLPNTIEEDAFTISDVDVADRKRNAQATFFMPVRLFEQDKGMLNFFTAIGDENIRRGVFLIAGEGPDKELMMRFVASRGLESNIQLLGFCDTEVMVSLYKRANVFLLPSFSDPSPLTLVEALIMKLPVLVSERCGNHWEAVVEGDNGYLFDPLDPSSVKRAFETLMSHSVEWERMGRRSGELYDAIFRRELVIENFTSALRNFPRTELKQSTQEA